MLKVTTQAGIVLLQLAAIGVAGLLAAELLRLILKLVPTV